MAKLQVLGQKCPQSGKMHVRGIFTQKKIIWAEMVKLTSSDLSDFVLFDDITGEETPITYPKLCAKMKDNGRVSICKNGQREFQIYDCKENEIREWDVDEEGKPRCNPIG
jgi:hypothetical protein